MMRVGEVPVIAGHAMGFRLGNKLVLIPPGDSCFNSPRRSVAASRADLIMSFLGSVEMVLARLHRIVEPEEIMRRHVPKNLSGIAVLVGLAAVPRRP